MQNVRCVSAMAAMAVFAAGGAFAQTTGYRGEARLANPATGPVQQTIGGVAWRCDGAACQGEAARKGNVDGVVRECRKVVAVIGPVSSYRSGARELTDSQVRACNKGAIQVQTARN